MANKNQYKAEQFIKAIPGSGGIIAVISSRVGCEWHTAQKYINDFPTVKAAYDDECERVADVAEGVVIKNIQFAAKEQDNTKKPVDSGDAKWWLSRKARGRGYSDKMDIDFKNIDLSSLTTEQLERLANGEDVYTVIATPGAG